MKKILITLMIISVLAVSIGFVVAKSGFDEFGHNDKARNFVGTCLSWHMGKFGSTEAQATTYCDIYSNNKLKMKWNAEWEGGNTEGWSDDNVYHGAWSDNQWNGMFPDGSGEIWHYMNRWIGSCGAYGALIPNRGYCIWGQFEVAMSHGTYDGQHHWDAHAIPAGVGP